MGFKEDMEKLNEEHPDLFSWAFWYENNTILSDLQKMYEDNGLVLKLTCGAVPEQYEVFDKSGVQVGYLRLRHGWFRVDYPDCGGETIYSAEPIGDGVFEDNERTHYMTEAMNAILNKLKTV